MAYFMGPSRDAPICNTLAAPTNKREASQLLPSAQGPRYTTAGGPATAPTSQWLPSRGLLLLLLPEYGGVHVWHVEADEGRVARAAPRLALHAPQHQGRACGSPNESAHVRRPAALKHAPWCGRTSCVELCHGLASPPQSEPEAVTVEGHPGIQILQHQHQAPASTQLLRQSPHQAGPDPNRHDSPKGCSRAAHSATPGVAMTLTLLQKKLHRNRGTSTITPSLADFLQLARRELLYC